MVHPDSSAVRRYPGGGRELARALSLGVALCNTASAYSPKEVLAVGGFRELKAWLDHDLWVRLIERGKPVANVDDVIAVHRVYPDSHFKRRHRSELHLSLALTRHLAERAPMLGQPGWLPWLRLPYRFTPMTLRHRLTPGSRPLPAETDRALRRYAHAEFLVIDDFAVLAMDPAQAKLAFQVISERYEYRRSTCITTNRPFKDWPKVFPDPLNAQVIAERLTERAEHFVLDKGFRPPARAKQRT
jgi:hypothetical protein